ncbi:MAG TPA: DUF1559 domain-containing protein, partial [Thermoguttaceae bacterium]|nr:DUF1559 domain-containing protein [Thermoguttaceae bacterium]
MFHPLSRRGLTLVEVLVVIFIIGVLLMLLWPSTCHVREAARRAYCLNTMMQMGLALHNYHDAHKCFPGSNDVRLLEKPSDSWADVPLHAPAQPDPSVGPAEYGTNFSWLAKITPYIEEGTFYQWLDMANRRAWDPCNDNPINPATGEPKDPAKPCHRMVWGAPIASFKCANFGEQRYCEANPAAGVTANPYDPKTPFGPAALTNYVALGATHSDSL